MGLNDIGAKLPPGFRFYPSDQELVCHYLHNKITNEDIDLNGTLVEIDLHICEPWQLPEVAKLNSSEWYFFSFRDRKYATGYRTNRATKTGYWKATGKDKTIVDSSSGALVGMRKTLVFYENRAPNGIKTGWIMHEFRLETPHIPPKEDWVLCRVFYKSKGENRIEFNSQNNINQVTSPNTITDSNPLCTADSQPPPCSCHHHVTTNSSHQSPPYFHHQNHHLNDYHPDFPQLSNVCLNTKYHDDGSGLFSDFALDFSIPSPMEFVDGDNWNNVYQVY